MGGRGAVTTQSRSLIKFNKIYKLNNLVEIMSKNKKYIVIGFLCKCPKCLNLMERRGHSNLKKQKKIPFYFSEWDYCKKCKHLQHYDKYKVFNKIISKVDFDEIKRQDSFLKSI